MRRTRRQTLAFNEEGIQLSQAELATLREAGQIAERARDLARRIDPDFDGHWLDLNLAGVEHALQEYPDGWLAVATEYRVSL